MSVGGDGSTATVTCGGGLRELGSSVGKALTGGRQPHFLKQGGSDGFETLMLIRKVRAGTVLYLVRSLEHHYAIDRSKSGM